MHNFDTLLLSISLLIVISILIVKFTKNIGVPVLLLFIGIGMLAGSEGPGNINFDNERTAQHIGIISLILILFGGGLETKWKTVKPVLVPSLVLATAGVAINTLLIGIFAHYIFHLPLLVSLLLGSVISSTDAAAVYSVLSFQSLNLRGRVRPLLELESGTNDPMAVFLTVSLIELIQHPQISYFQLATHFIMEMGIGSIAGIIGGRLVVVLINQLRFPIEGFYSVFLLAWSIFIYALTTTIHGSGFLAVYIAGVIIGNSEIVFRKTLFRFFDGLGWLAQIGMFISLGLLVYPSEIVKILDTGILLSLFLIFMARPISVFLSLSFSKLTIHEKLLISWVGLRGAVPVILATFPLIAGIPKSYWIFNVVFFVVLTSAIIQGWSTPYVAKVLNLQAKKTVKKDYPLELNPSDNTSMKLINMKVPDNERILNKSLVEINELKGSLIVTILRKGKYFVPAGSTVLEAGDIIQVLTEKDKIKILKTYFS